MPPGLGTRSHSGKPPPGTWRRSATEHKIRVGIIGVGSWGEVRAPARAPDPRPDRGRRRLQPHDGEGRAARRELSIPYAFDDHEPLVLHPDVNLVVLPAPAPEHAKLVTAAIAAGIGCTRGRPDWAATYARTGGSDRPCYDVRHTTGSTGPVVV
jgi:hypothetical protein